MEDGDVDRAGGGLPAASRLITPGLQMRPESIAYTVNIVN